MHLDGLMAHQAAGVPWLLANPRGMLAWEMGVGKTVTASRAWENSADLGPALVVCLASARENWRREILRFAIDKDWPPKVQVLRDKSEQIDPAADVVIINYDKLLQAKFINRLRAARRWGALILDEAHVLKNPTAQRTKLIYGGGHHMQTPLIANAERVWPLTGTPMPSHPGELWSHAYHLWPERIIYRDDKPMELWEFELGFCEIKQNKYGLQVVGGKNLEELKARLAPCMNRLRRAECLDLPPLRVDSWPLDGETTSGIGKYPDIPGLLGTLAERYGTVDLIESFDNSTLDVYLACILQQNAQLATIRRETATLKAVAAALMLREEFELGAPKTVVFAYHREAIDTLSKVLAAYKPAIIHGGVPEGKRQGEIDRFQTDPSCHVFVGQLTAAGASINLQAAQNVVFVEADWTPGVNEQALSRVYRNGQTKPVLVRFLYLPGSIDEAVNRALARKAAMISQVIN